MYRKADYLFYDHPEERFAIGDRTAGLKYDSDGGLTLQLSHQRPDEINNWLPAPAEPFYLALRLYLPRQVHQNHTYQYPAIELQSGTPG
jgi:hypothetical protein